MKKILFSLLLVGGTIGAFAQGTITFNNNSTTLVSFVAAEGGAAVQQSDGLTAVLWVSPTETSDVGALTPVASTPVGEISTFPVAGRFSGGIVAVPGVAEGASAWFAVSINNGFVDLANLGTIVGLDGIFERPTGGGINAPGDLTSVSATYPNALGPINVALVPEPSVILLGVAGAGLLWFRRKK